MKKRNIELIKSKVMKYENISIDDINLNEIDDLTTINISKRKPSKERMLDFLNEVKNPYVFKVNGKIVKISFAKTDKTADDCLTNVLKNLYR